LKVVIYPLNYYVYRDLSFSKYWFAQCTLTVVSCFFQNEIT